MNAHKLSSKNILVRPADGLTLVLIATIVFLFLVNAVNDLLNGN
jgi:hypothetical protein